MKKKAILAGIAAIMGVSGFYGYSAATAGSGLSGRGMENASILSDPDIKDKYSTCCMKAQGSECKLSPYHTVLDATDCDEPSPDPDKEED